MSRRERKRSAEGKVPKRGHKADYRRATPEEVGRALLRYRPAKQTAVTEQATK